MLESLKQEDLQFTELSPEEKQSRGILARLTGPIASFTKGTRNGRKYSDKLWEKAFDSPLVKEMFKNGGLPGELQHPADRSETDPTKIAIMMPEPPKKDNKGHLVASVDILDTPCGQIAYQLGKYGFKFGISSRGEGDLIQDFSGEESVDPDTYTLNAFDLVLIPACEDARLQFNESLDSKKTNKLKAILNESLNNASDSDRKIMEAVLDELDIEDNIQFVNTYENVDIFFDPERKKYLVYGMDGDEELFNSERNAKKYIDKFVLKEQILTEEQVGREETKDSEKASEILKNKPENEKEVQSDTTTEVSVNIDNKENKDTSVEEPEKVIINNTEQSEEDDEDLEEAIEDEEPERAPWDTEFHRLDVAYNHNFKQFKDRDADSGLIRDFTDDLENYGKDYDIYYHKTDPGCTVFFQESLHESIEWSELNGTEQSAVEAALAEIKRGSSIEDAVHGAVSMYNDANSEAEYEDEDFFMEEADYTKVLDYVKNHEGLTEGAVTPKKNIQLVAKEFKYTLSYNNEPSEIVSAVVIIPDAFKLSDGSTMDAVVHCEDLNGKEINFNSVEEAQNWIDNYGKDCLYRVDPGNELHATPEQAYKLDNAIDVDINAADDSGAIVEQLQHILKQNKSLSDKIKTLQEKLSVGYAKEMSLKEELDSCKQKLTKLSQKTKEIKVLTEKVATAEKLLKEAEEKAKGDITTLNESILSKDSETKDLRKDIAVLNEAVSKKNTKIKSLNEAIGKYEDELSSKENDIKQLQEQYETGQKDLEQLRNQYSKKIEQQNQIIEKYQRVAKNSVKRYIESQAVRLGVKSDEIVNRLPKNYSFNDIDRICEDLQEYKFNMSNLPFSHYGLNENLKVTAKNINNGLVEANPDDEITDYDLKVAEAFL